MSPLRLYGLLLALVSAAAGAQSGASKDACHASFEKGELLIGNARVERRWLLTGSALQATSFRDLAGNTEWLAPSKPASPPAPAEFSVKRGRFGAVEAESLVAELAVKGAKPVTYRFQIFSAASAVSIQVIAGGSEQAAAATGLAATGVESAAASAAKPLANVLDALPMAPQHLRIVQVDLMDQTDIHNELVHEREWLMQTNEKIRVTGNLLIVENTLTRAGLILLKEAPLPHARPVRTETDFEVDAARRRVSVSGLRYRVAALGYSGGAAGRTAALQEYQRQLRTYDAKRDAMFLSNTWGDRSRDARINAAFMQAEIEAGAKLGVDVIQIDDGWQKGRTANSATAGGVWNGFWAADPRFWAVNAQRFPEGLQPLIARARQAGMQFGLWFAPDSSHDFANWNRDASQLLEYCRTHGVRYFKIDGVKSTSAPAEENLRKLFARVLDESQGQVTFDLDVTAEIRPGYFGSMSTGPLFVENRYTDWHRYWPHQTLRNLWKLAHYVDPLRLRMEFLNNARNEKMYPDDPLAPARYSPAYLFAVTMFASPLGWFEMSNLPPTYFEQLPPLVKRWKQERAEIFTGSMLPIGAAPDGTAWTGFASVAASRESAQVLVFREENATAEWTCALPLLAPGAYRVSVLGGEGSASMRGGALTVKLPRARSFIWLRVSR